MGAGKVRYRLSRERPFCQSRQATWQAVCSQSIAPTRALSNSGGPLETARRLRAALARALARSGERRSANEQGLRRKHPHLKRAEVLG